MTVQLQDRPIHDSAITGPCSDLNMDLVDSALDRGDLETVRRALGLTAEAWRLVLANL